MKKLITASILLLCLGSASFAQTAKGSSPVTKNPKASNAQKLHDARIIAAKKAKQKSMATSHVLPMEAVKQTN